MGSTILKTFFKRCVHENAALRSARAYYLLSMSARLPRAVARQRVAHRLGVRHNSARFVSDAPFMYRRIALMAEFRSIALKASSICDGGTGVQSSGSVHKLVTMFHAQFLQYGTGG